MKKSLLILAFTLLACTIAQAQSVLQKSSIKVRGKDQRLIFSVQGKIYRLDVSQYVDAAKLDEVQLLFASRRGPFNYLVIDACGPSRAESNDRQCGAGRECDLLWMKFTSDWRMSEIKSVRYESCWLPITSEEGYKLSGKGLELEYSDFRNKKQYKLRYDAEKPEEGFRIEESAIADGT